MSALLAHPDNLTELVDRARSGDVEAFGAIFDQQQPGVYRLMLRMTQSHALAEDLTSETFFRALRAITTSQVRGDYVTAWLMRIARNLAVDHFKAKQNRLEVPVDPYDAEAVAQDVADGPEDEVLSAITHVALLGALGDLPANQRACITARFLDDLSIAETALLMGCSEGAVKQLQYRGIRKLAQRLPPDLG